MKKGIFGTIIVLIGLLMITIGFANMNKYETKEEKPIPKEIKNKKTPKDENERHKEESALYESFDDKMYMEPAENGTRIVYQIENKSQKNLILESLKITVHDKNNIVIDTLIKKVNEEFIPNKKKEYSFETKYKLEEIGPILLEYNKA